ncbi:uncharacterized protein LOC123565070 [Mercenaria mercenaria]|uniref:uncharacterized protein LOC123565070 n=1 Tax=Mercenaria mercenaria TaxID=6596 RepID=UPI001E1DC130|nr:uncharacterized protein LOC123565070 [Mercenaria mercenaria]
MYNNSSIDDGDKAAEMKSGYDLPVYGLANGTFYYIHIPALICIFSSLCCVIIVLTLSFRHRSYRTFFSWTKSERFIVYLAICDGGFNIFHSVDHLHYVIVKDHVHPKELCEFYGFTLAEFITAQNLIVNIVAINAFMLMYFHKNLNFGKRDWKLLTWTFGVPFVGATAAAISGQFGPGGSFCYFDGVKGGTAYIFFTTVPLLIIIVMNSVMYVLTWRRIRQETSSLCETYKNVHMVNKSKRAAKTMTMFVVAFFIQWFSLAVFGVWVLIDPNVPQPMIHIITIFSNIGGCLNLCVYIIMRRRSRADKHEDSKEKIIDSNELKSKSDSGHVTKSSELSQSNV